MDSRSEQLIANLNQRIPPGVDWKAGALNYLTRLFEGEQREPMRRFHLVKPFTTLQDRDASIREQSQEFTRELAFFAHILSILEFSPQASFLDVACGTGWVSHYLAKLGLRVCGFDISDDMIGLAEERMKADPWPTTDGKPLNVDLCCHDIEDSPLSTDELFDVAILESALHHFVDPVAALRNIRSNLKEDGIVIIIEGSSDGDDVYCRDIMQRYDTLERPYTPAELDEILVCAGFPAQQRLVPISGFFHPGLVSSRSVTHLLCDDRSWNTVVAFNSSAAKSKSVTLQGSATPSSYLIDASGDLVTDLQSDHWIGPMSDLVLHRHDEEAIGLLFCSPLPNLNGSALQLRITPLDHPDHGMTLKLQPSLEGDAEISVVLPLPGGFGSYHLSVSGVFSPSWSDPGGDQRLLSGRIRLMPVRELPELMATFDSSLWLPVDGWIGPDCQLEPPHLPGSSLSLCFTSPLPNIRRKAQTIWITVQPTGEHHKLELKPHKRHDPTAKFLLPMLPEGCRLRIQSSDCFNPAWDGSNDDRLISVRVEALP